MFYSVIISDLWLTIFHISDIGIVAALDPIILTRGPPIKVATPRLTTTLTLYFSLCIFPLAESPDPRAFNLDLFDHSKRVN